MITASPIVYNSVVYAGTHDGNVYALDAINGREIWRYQTGGIIESTPTAYALNLYVNSYDGYTYSFNAPTGDLW